MSFPFSLFCFSLAEQAGEETEAGEDLQADGDHFCEDMPRAASSVDVSEEELEKLWFPGSIAEPNLHEDELVLQFGPIFHVWSKLQL